MGKRSNRDAPVGRRRPMIQLGKSSQKSGIGSVSRAAIKEEEEKAKQIVKVPAESKADDHIDNQLAGFLAEINSLDNTSEDISLQPSQSETLNITPHNNITQNTSNNSNLLYDPATFDPSTQGHLLPESWQACYDESTLCYYYWNTLTNEVQWYPPTATVPPPPPLDEQHVPPQPLEEEDTNDCSSNNNKSVVAIENTETKIYEENNEVSSEEMIENDIISEKQTEIKKQVDDSVLDNEGTQTSRKDEDRKLMSEIAEKIRKKKLLKEKEEEERISREKEETMLPQEKLANELTNEEKIADEEKKEKLLNTQIEKEDLLREKLIKKKLEREKTVSPELKETEAIEKSDVSIDQITTVSAKDEEAFMVDIFASEDAKLLNETPENDMEVKEEKQLEYPIESIESEVEKTEQSDVVENVSDQEPSLHKNTVNTTGIVNQRETKGGWRIIDAVYDDDEEEEDEEEGGDESEMEVDKPEGNKVVEMDDYAEMLLEGAIGESDKVCSVGNTDNQPTLPSEVPPPPPEQDVRPPLPPEDEPLPELPKVSIQEEESIRKEIGTISTEIFEKLDFLGISNKDLRNLQIYYIELETRMKDWQAGALDSKYFVEQLYELNAQILKHEETAAPMGWLCHWSSNFKMYYYYNSMTGESQWEYPSNQVAMQPTSQVVSMQPSTQMSMQPTAMDYHASYMQASMVVPMMNPMAMGYIDPTQVMNPVADKSLSLSATAASIVSPAHGFSREPIPKETKKRAASSDQDKVPDPYRDPYRSIKKKKESDTDDSSQISATESGTASPARNNVIAAAPYIRDASREGSPSVYTAPPPLPDDDGVSSPLPPMKKDSSSSSLVGKTKIKKKKRVETSGLPSKKLKQVSSLVQKWQTVKQKVEEEENIEEESEDEDYEVQSEKRIAEWKKEIESSGKMGYNPNFTEIKGDWRERLKRKTKT